METQAVVGRSTVRRLAVISLHTSPLAQPGTGDAGGLNVYVAQTTRRLAGRGLSVDVFTRATGAGQPAAVQPWPGVTVRHVVAGPLAELAKHELPDRLDAFAAAVLEGSDRQPGYDLVHSHYWLSGRVGSELAGRWGVPLVHSAHTLARVKNASRAAGDPVEPPRRVRGEEQVVARADRLVVNTEREAQSLVRGYRADPQRVDVVPPGVDTDLFAPGDAAADRTRLGIGPHEVVLVFAGRLQPHKGPDVLIRAAAELIMRYPDRDFRVIAVGGSSGPVPPGLRRLADELGIGAQVQVGEPLPPDRLARLFRAADVVAVPSHTESFGLVALEAQACGTPVVAAAVGGLPVAVADGVSGVLVSGHDPRVWADRLAQVVLDPAHRARLAAGAPGQAARFSWEATVDGLLASYRRALTPSIDRAAG